MNDQGAPPANAELGGTAYDLGTGASESAVNSVTSTASMTDLGLGGASQAAEGAGAEGLGGVVSGMKLAYDVGTFMYGIGHCLP